LSRNAPIFEPGGRWRQIDREEAARGMIRDRLDTQTDEAIPPLRSNLCRKCIVGHEIDAFQRAIEAPDCSVGTSTVVTQKSVIC